MKIKVEIPETDPKDARERILEEDLVLIGEAWRDFEGQLEVFESAVGALMLGRLAGFDALRVVHGSRTLRRYEGVLCGISFKERLEPRTKDSMRVNGLRRAVEFKQFWKALGAGIASEPGAKDLART
jgi:hypothetical protein